MATTEKPTTTAEVNDQIREIRSDVSKLMEILGTFAETRLDATKSAAKEETEHLLRRSKDMADAAQGKARDATESVESYIKEKPIQAALMALVVGILFGAFSRR